MSKVPTNERVEIFYDNGYRMLRALKNFHQGELIIELPQSTGRHSIESSPAGVINHSCDPNSSVRNGRIIAFKCIKEGDEVTLDYKKTEQKLAALFICECGSKNCKGLIE